MNPKTTQKIANIFLKSSGAVTLMILMIIVGYILVNGISAVSWEFIFSSPADSGKSGGIFPMIISTVYLLAVSMTISVPVGVGSAIYIAEYAHNKKLISAIRFISQTLASVPSIVFGLFGLAFLVFFLKLGWSILTGGIVLAIMAIPTIFQVSEIAISSVPEIYKEGCFGLGATKWQCIKSIILPQAIPGIVTGIVLALTRSISEAAAVMYVAGSSLEIPLSVLDAGRPLALHLYMLASEGISISNAYGVALVLILIVLAITLSMNFAVDYYQKKTMGM